MALSAPARIEQAVQDVFPLHSFRFGESIAGGCFRHVLKAHHPIFNDVAIEIFNSENRVTVINEAKYIRKLCAYPSIVNVYCVADAGEGKEVGIVMESMKLGNLKDFQQQKVRKIPWALRMRMLKEISEGMYYLHHHHEPPFVHGDLKAENIFVQETLSVKIGDVGLRYMMTPERSGTPTHMPPEYFDASESPNPKWDVYSFGILQYEVASGKNPFEALKGDVTRLRFFVEAMNERPYISGINECPPVINELTKECWDREPANRPDFKDVKWRIQNAYRSDFEESINRAIVEVYQQLDKTTETDVKYVDFDEQISELRIDEADLPSRPFQTAAIFPLGSHAPAIPGAQTAAPTAHYATVSTTLVVPLSTGRRPHVEQAPAPLISHGFKEIDNDDIQCVKKHLRKNMFRDLGREFDLTEAEMDAIKEDNHYYGEQVHELINKWRQKKGPRTRHDLANCLQNLDLTIINELNKLGINEELEFISVKLYGKWMQFGKHFGFQMEELSEIKRNFLQETDASLEMLKRWKAWKEDTEGFRATIDALINYDGKEIPAEILARGPDAWNIFTAAREEGEKDFNLFRLNVIGQENVGKTCLIDSMLGNEFNEQHVITDAIAVTRSCMHDETDPTKWQTDEVANKDEMKGKYENALAEKIVEDLQQKGNYNVKTAQETKKQSHSDDVMPELQKEPKHDKLQELHKEVLVNKQQVSSFETRHEEYPQRISKKDVEDFTSSQPLKVLVNKQQVSSFETTHEEYPQRISKKDVEDFTSSQPLKGKQQMTRIETKMGEVIAEKVKNALKGDARCLITDDTSIRIWDFGGQPIYHNILRFFLTPEGTFIIVFKLTDDLNAFTIIEDSNGKRRKYYMTNLEHLLFWIRSSYTYCSKSKRDLVLLLDLPACIVVGTHRNALADTEEERERLVKEQFDQIRNAIQGKLYESHVYPTFFDVENQLGSSDKNIGKMKEVILKIKDRMKRTIPLKWFEFLIKIQELSAENLTLPLEEVISKAKECGITDEKTIDLAIAYFSDVGEIMHHPMEEALCDTVVLQPMKLVDYVKTVFTVIKPELRDATLQDEWRDLEKGVLRKSLLKHLWRNFQVFSDDKNDEMLNFFIALMKKFGLICQRKTRAGHGSDDSIFYAFSHIQPAFETRVMKDDQGYDKVSIFHDFCGYLPDYVFQHVVTRFIEEFLVENAANPNLAYEYVELDVDAHHRVSLAVATIKHRRMFKTTILKRQVIDATNVTEPEPETCKKVLTYLQSVFDALCKTSTRGIQYKTCVPCGCCNNFQHMQIINDFNENVIPCGLMLWSITRYRRLFGDSSEATTTVAYTDQCHLKEMVLQGICDALDKEWKKLAYCLGLTKVQLDVIERDNIKTGDAMMTMLVKWRNQQPSDINQKDVMKAALKQAGYVRIADELTGNTSNSGVLHDNDLLTITDGLGTHWARFGVRVGFEWQATQMLKAEHNSDYGACMDMLTTWKKRQSCEINQVDVMCKLLKQHGFSAVADQLRCDVNSEATPSTTTESEDRPPSKRALSTVGDHASSSHQQPIPELILKEEDFYQLLEDVCSWWKQYGNVNMLKVLLRNFDEQIALAQIEESNEPSRLFNLLCGPGLISPSDIDVVIEAAVLGGLHGVELKIKKKVPTFPEFNNIVICRFSKYRQNLIKFGRILSVDKKERIGRLYNIPSDQLADQWVLIFELEKRNILTAEKKESFIQKLEVNGMKQEADALK